ncbi:MAG: bacteriohemerythrin [Terracidiphilus sp.]|jgi:hemerythrin
MALLKWSSKYSVGVKALDDQHNELIEMLNELHAAMLKGQAQSVAGSLLPKLVSGANKHFSTEEQLMESTKYPGLAEQRAEHRALIGKAEEYVVRFKKGDNAMYLELLSFLRDWLSNHMVQVDQKYTTWMNEHGVR